MRPGRYDGRGQRSDRPFAPGSETRAPAPPRNRSGPASHGAARRASGPRPPLPPGHKTPAPPPPPKPVRPPPATAPLVEPPAPDDMFLPPDMADVAPGGPPPEGGMEGPAPGGDGKKGECKEPKPYWSL